MRIRTTTLAAGPAGVVPADTEMEVPDELAKVMIDSGAAVEVAAKDVDQPADPEESEESEVETATAEPTERAAKRTRTRRG